jgi:hypothetical protein
MYEYFATIAENLKENLLDENFNQPTTLTMTYDSDRSILMYPTTRTEIKSIIDGLKNDAASGLDACSSKILKKLSDDLSPFLVRAVNKSMRDGRFPTGFKAARIVAIHKGGNKLDPGNYRPIAVLSCLSKIFERVLYNRIANFLEGTDFFDSNQFGFLPRSSTTSAALAAVSRIRMSLDKGCYTAAIFIDVSKAFDCVDHSILLTKLFRCGVRGNGFKIIQDYLFARTQVISSSQGESSSKFMTRGVPQGSSLSALLFLIYINDIFELPLKGHLQLYADDAILIYSESDYDELQRHMKEDLLKIYDWFYNNLLSFNVSKTKYIIFNPKNKNIPQPNRLLVRGAEIERVRCIKYLGLMIDEKMDWTEHISYIKTKIRPFLAMLRRTTYLIPSSTRLSVYYSYIHCHLTYLAPLWGYTTNTRLDELTRFQNKAIRLIFWQDYRGGTNTEDLFRKYHILRINQIVKYEGMMTIFKLDKGLMRSTLSLPLYSDVHDHFTRTHTNFYLPNPRTNYLKRSLFFTGLTDFNCLPASVKMQDSLVDFKRMLKTHLFST